MKSFLTVNLGCKVNAYECDAIANILEDNGITYKILAPTGKAAKYPYTMFFNCKNGNITFTGKIEYLSNNAMGKISITIFDSKNTFEIAVAVKNSSLQITRIGQAIFNKQYMTDIFNINKQ